MIVISILGSLAAVGSLSYLLWLYKTRFKIRFLDEARENGVLRAIRFEVVKRGLRPLKLGWWGFRTSKGHDERWAKANYTLEGNDVQAHVLPIDELRARYKRRQLEGWPEEVWFENTVTRKKYCRKIPNGLRKEIQALLETLIGVEDESSNGGD